MSIKMGINEKQLQGIQIKYWMSSHWKDTYVYKYLGVRGTILNDRKLEQHMNRAHMQNFSV